MQKSNEDINVNDALNANKFRLVFPELKAMEILCRSAPIPSVSSSPIEISNSFNRSYVQSQKVSYDPLSITFRVDKNLTSFIQIYKWYRDIHSPQDHEGFNLHQKESNKISSKNNISVDASLFSLTNSMNPSIEVKFFNVFPTSLSSIDFSLDNSDNVVASATFQYDYYDFIEKR